MGLQKIVVLCAILLALGVSGWYFLKNNEGAPADMAGESNSVDQSEENTDSFTGFGSISELLQRGDSFTCDFRVENPDNVSQGTVYLDGDTGRYRMNGTYEANGERGSFSTIVNENVLYWWGDTPDGPMGMRMSLQEGDPTADFDVYDGTIEGSVSADEQVAYDCDRWSVDTSIFVPPSNVEFTDMDEMMNAMMEGMGEGFEMPEGMEHFMQ